jgi:NADPH:quinone reductase-like Zn-dependent oxidoreductase
MWRPTWSLRDLEGASSLSAGMEKRKSTRARLLEKVSHYGASLLSIPPSRHAQISAAVVAGLEFRTLRPRVVLTLPFQEIMAAEEAIEAARGFGRVALVMQE